MLEPFGVGNRRPMFEADERSVEVKPVKLLSQHISVKSPKIELMYFGGSKFTFLIESNAPKKFIFSYNISVFRGKEYVKGYIKDIVCERNAASSCGEEIYVNNILTLACPEYDCKKSFKTIAEIDALLNGNTGYGTVCIAGEYKTLKYFKNASKLSVDVFRLSSCNLADTVIISPQ